MKDKKYNYPFGFGMMAARTRNFETYLRMMANDKGVGVCISNETLEVVRACAEKIVNDCELAALEHEEVYG